MAHECMGSSYKCIDFFSVIIWFFFLKFWLTSKFTFTQWISPIKKSFGTHMRRRAHWREKQMIEIGAIYDKMLLNQILIWYWYWCMYNECAHCCMNNNSLCLRWWNWPLKNRIAWIEKIPVVNHFYRTYDICLISIFFLVL